MKSFPNVTVLWPAIVDFCANMDAVTEAHNKPSVAGNVAESARPAQLDHDDDLEMAKSTVIVTDSTVTSGTARAEAMQLVWGKNGRLIVWLGICIMLIV